MMKSSRVADSSLYSQLNHYEQVDANPTRPQWYKSLFKALKLCRSYNFGHFPVYVGEEMERFTVSAQYLNHPFFIKLLDKSAEEYGYEQQGVLRIPCNVHHFRIILDAIRVGQISPEVEDIVNSL